MSPETKKPLLFGRIVIPALFWVIIGPIAALLAWLFMKKKGYPKTQ